MLTFSNVSFRVSAGVQDLEIIDNVSFEINGGEFIVFTGPNGGGKSTIARLIMGIETPTEGKILFNGQDITALSVTERAKLGIGYAFQQPPRFKGLTIRRLLSLAAGEELSESECCQYLGDVGLCAREYVNREFDTSLSGGESKRVELATLMARKLRLAIFDEPEAGIDLWSFSVLVESFKNLCHGRHDSVVIISHQERIMRLADRIMVIAEGKIREDAPRDELLPDLLRSFNDDDCNCPAKGECNHGKAQ